MPVTLHRLGNSIGLRIPKPLLEQLGLGEGSRVDVKIENGRLVIEPHRKKLTLKELLVVGGLQSRQPARRAGLGRTGRQRNLVVPAANPRATGCEQRTQRRIAEVARDCFALLATTPEPA